VTNSITIPVELAVEAHDFIRDYAEYVTTDLPGTPDPNMRPNLAQRICNEWREALEASA
jgi:hypothetical protein